MTADDVLLQTFESIDLAADGSLAEHLGGLLEGSGGHEAVGPQCGTGNTLEYLVGCRGDGVAGLYELEILTLESGVLVPEPAGRNDLTGSELLGVSCILYDFLAEHGVVLLVELPFVHQLLRQEAGVARIYDLNLAHHLAHDDLEMLVVDLHALHTVDFLNLVDDVLLHLDGTLDGQDVGGRYGTVGQGHTCADVVVLLYENLL